MTPLRTSGPFSLVKPTQMKHVLLCTPQIGQRRQKKKIIALLYAQQQNTYLNLDEDRQSE